VFTRLALSLIIFFPASVLAAPRVSFDALLADLKSPNAKTRQDAASALGKSRKREAVSALSAVVRDPEPKVRLEVVHALKELRDPAGIPALVAATEDEEKEIRKEASGVLVYLYIEDDRPTGIQRFLGAPDDYEDVMVGPSTSVEPMVVRALTASLRDEDKTLREQGALALGMLGARSSLKELAAALQDPEPSVRGAAAAAIAKLQGAEHAGALIGLLTDTSAEVRNRALRAIGALRIKEAGAPLRELYEANHKKDIGVRALDALSKVGDPAQADLFRELVAEGDEHRKRLAIEGLARLQETSLLPAFKKDYQRESREDVRLALSFGITKLGDPAFLDGLVRALSSKHGKRCREYLLELGRPVLAELYEYLGDSDAEVRARLCEILGLMGDAETITRLSPMIGDPNASVSDSANRAIEQLKRVAAGVASAP
jgi:HEAT repeat protein